MSLRKFTENLQWINKCSSIAPSYNYTYSCIDLYLIMGTLKFNPLLEKAQIKKIIERWPFYYLLKLSVNSFALEIFVTFHVTKAYLKDFLGYINKLENYGYCIEKKLYHILNKTEFINLNYYTDMSNIKRIIKVRIKRF
ncbi:MAG: hypothetical protein ACFFBC_03435 [Promethearchaeota archaeon]